MGVRISNLGFVLALMMGIIVAWGVAVPRQTDGEFMRGSCDPCRGTQWVTCPPRSGKVCAKRALRCILYPDASGECFSTTWSNCSADPACVSLTNQSCQGY